jgi:N-acetylneuraminic acid mutarotase
LTGGAVFAATVKGTDGRIYVITGSTESGQLTARNSAYDPRQDTWTTLAPIPTPRSEPGAALGIAANIYVIGGNPGTGRKQSSRMNTVEAYDPRTDRWITCRSLPTPRTALCAVAASDATGRCLLFAIGGRNFDIPGNGLNTVEAYDPLTDSWSTRSPMAINLHGMTATLGPDGKIYVFGGTNSKVTDTNEVHVYDPATDGWSPSIAMPYGQECACSTFTPGANGEVVVLGGWGDLSKTSLSSVAAYNPRTQSWRGLPQLPVPAAAAGAVSVEGPDGFNRIYVIGGLPSSSSVQELCFRPAGSAVSSQDR